MRSPRPSLIVAGVDGTPTGQAALTFAMREATLRGSALDVVTTWQWIPAYHPSLGQEPADVHRRAQDAQDAAISAALAITSAPPVISRYVIEGEPGPSLLEVSKTADYLVVGTEHRHAVARVILGSVSRYCMRHASCPVVVVPAERRLSDEDTADERALAGVLRALSPGAG